MTSTSWDETKVERAGEADPTNPGKFATQHKGHSTAEFPAPRTGSWKYPPKLFTDVAEAVGYWASVDVPDETLEAVNDAYKKFWKERTDGPWRAIRRRRSAPLMVEAVERFPEPRQVAQGDWNNQHRLDDPPEWYLSKSASVQDLRDNWIYEQMTPSREADVRELEALPDMPIALRQTDVPTVARVARMVKDFAGDPDEIRGVVVEWRDEGRIPVGEIEQRMKGFGSINEALA